MTWSTALALSLLLLAPSLCYADGDDDWGYDNYDDTDYGDDEGSYYSDHHSHEYKHRPTKSPCPTESPSPPVPTCPAKVSPSPTCPKKISPSPSKVPSQSPSPTCPKMSFSPSPSTMVPSRSPSPTASTSPSAVPSSSPSVSASPSPSSSPPSSPSGSPSPSVSPSFSPSASASSSATPLPSQSASPSPSISSSPSSSFSVSPSPSSSSSPSPSPSTIPSLSPSPSPSVSVTPSSTPSASSSPSESPSSSPSLTPSTSPSGTPSTSPSPSASPTPSSSTTPSATPSTTPTPSPSPTSSPSTSVSPILSTPGPSPLPTATTTPLASVCPQPLLGAAAGFSAFVLGTASGSNATSFAIDLVNGDFESKVAVNGGLRLRSFGIFQNTPCTGNLSQDVTVVVSGAVDAVDSRLFCGNLLVTNQSQIISLPTFQTGNGVAVSDVIDFSAVRSNLTSVSASLCALANVTPADTSIFGDVRLPASGLETEVFSIDTASLSRTGFMRLTNVDASVTRSVIINVLGSGVATFSNFFFSTGAIPEGRITWNICSADRVIIENVLFPGTLLAPLAAVTLQRAQVVGSVVASSLSGAGGGQINQALCP